MDELAVVDPVCGMRIMQSAAEATATCRGHPYYFCSGACEAKFLRNPTAFVEVKTN